MHGHKYDSGVNPLKIRPYPELFTSFLLKILLFLGINEARNSLDYDSPDKWKEQQHHTIVMFHFNNNIKQMVELKSTTLTRLKISEQRHNIVVFQFHNNIKC